MTPCLSLIKTARWPYPNTQHTPRCSLPLLAWLWKYLECAISSSSTTVSAKRWIIDAATFHRLPRFQSASLIIGPNLAATLLTLMSGLYLRWKSHFNRLNGRCGNILCDEASSRLLVLLYVCAFEIKNKQLPRQIDNVERKMLTDSLGAVQSDLHALIKAVRAHTRRRQRRHRTWNQPRAWLWIVLYARHHRLSFSAAQLALGWRWFFLIYLAHSAAHASTLPLCAAEMRMKISQQQ